MFILYLSLSVPTVHHYGVTFDEPEHWTFGDRYLQFYLTFDRKVLDFSGLYWSPVQTWPVGPTLAALSAKVFSERLKLVDQSVGHHLASIILLGILLGSMYLFLAVHADRTIAVLSCVALAMHPRVWGDAHNNSEDIAHLVFYAMAILAFLHGVMTQRARWLLASAVCWGLALGSKINALSLPLVIAPVLIPAFWDGSLRATSTRRSLAVYPLIAFLVLFLAWPYLWENPLERLAHFWSYLLFWGYSGPPSWQASPFFSVLITTPLPTLAFALLGIFVSAWSGAPFGRRANLVILAWLLVPITRSSLPYAVNYDVIRRFMEFAPAMAIMAGIGGASLNAWTGQSRWMLLRRSAWAIKTALFIAFLSPALAIWRYFPYEGTYYNLLASSLGEAQALTFKDTRDYGSSVYSSYREGINWINAHADPGAYLVVPNGRHLIPYYSPRQDLVMASPIWIDELPTGGRPAYLMYALREPYDYNMCLAEAFLRPEYEIRRDGGVLLRIYTLRPESHFSVGRNVLPPPQRFTATHKRGWVTLRWEPTYVGDIVGHILYYTPASGQYHGSRCLREHANRWESFAGAAYGIYYLSLSVLTRQAQESQRTPELRMEFFEEEALGPEIDRLEPVEQAFRGGVIYKPTAL